MISFCSTTCCATIIDVVFPRRDLLLQACHVLFVVPAFDTVVEVGTRAPPRALVLFAAPTEAVKVNVAAAANLLPKVFKNVALYNYLFILQVPTLVTQQIVIDENFLSLTDAWNAGKGDHCCGA